MDENIEKHGTFLDLTKVKVENDMNEETRMDEDIEEHVTFPGVIRLKTEVKIENEEIIIEDYNLRRQVKEEPDCIYNNETDTHGRALDMPGINSDVSLTLGMTHSTQKFASGNMGHTGPVMNQGSKDMSNSSPTEYWVDVAPSNSIGSQNAVIPLESSHYILNNNSNTSVLNVSHRSFIQSWESNSGSNNMSDALNVSNKSLQYTYRIATEEILYDEETHKLNSQISKTPYKSSIGSKPAKFNAIKENMTRKEFLPATVILEDWASKLANNTCYCQICEILFPTEISLDAHKMTFHSLLIALDRSEAVKSTSSGVNIKTESSEYDSDNSEIESTREETYSPGATISVNNFYKIKRERKPNSYIPRPKNMQYQYSRVLKVKNPPIPIGILYKCKKCDLHLLNVMNAFYHCRICDGSTGYQICGKCNRNFKNSDLELHRLQHLVSKSFKVYLLHHNFCKRVLCRCPRCNICYNEPAYWQHLKSKVCNKNFIYCYVCNLKICDEHTFLIHVRYHSKDSKTKLVVVDYFDRMQRDIVKEVSDGDITNKLTNSCDLPTKSDVGVVTSSESLQHDVTFDNMYKLLYCETCNTCCMVDKIHSIEICKNSKKCICLSCGLYFTKNSMRAHKKLHIGKSLDLHNFLLFSRKTRNQIQPPVQNYSYCVICEAHYVGRKFNHFCFLNRIICNICFRVFDGDTSHNLHVEFHKYKLQMNSGVIGTNNRPTVLDKSNVRGKETVPEESINSAYIYQCIKCLKHTGCYDAAVKHAQQHIVYTNFSQGLFCNKCEKYYDVKLFKTHNHNFQYYKVLEYDYQNLLTESWFDMFEGLHQAEVESILRKSLYKDTRRVKLKLVKSGDPDLTIYICELCDISVDKNSLAKHVSNPASCLADSNYKCTYCNINFCSSDTINAHKKIHSGGVTIKDFRIIYISSYKTSRGINKLLKPGNESKSGRPKTEVGTSVETNVETTLVLYKCKTCNICLETITVPNKHHCSFKLDSRRFCHICKQYIYFIKLHRRRHKDNVKFNLVIEYFEPINKFSTSIVQELPDLITSTASEDKITCVHIPENVKHEKCSENSDKLSQLVDEVPQCTVNKFNTKIVQDVPELIISSVSEDKIPRVDILENAKYEKYSKNSDKLPHLVDEVPRCTVNKFNTKIVQDVPELLSSASEDKISCVDIAANVKHEECPDNSDKLSLLDDDVPRCEENSRAKKLELPNKRNIVLYKCKKCCICYEMPRFISVHCCSFRSFYFCIICKQYFSDSTHKKRHRRRLKFNIVIRYFEPKSVVKDGSELILSSPLGDNISGENSGNSDKLDSQSNDEGLRCYENSQTSNKFRSSDKIELIDKSQRKIMKLEASDHASQIAVDHLNIQVQTQIEGTVTKRNVINLPHNVYVCNQCNVCFLNRSGWFMHVFKKKHVFQLMGLASCIYCRLTFTTVSLKRHFEFHKELTPIRIIDLITQTATIYNWTDTVSHATKMRIDRMSFSSEKRKRSSKRLRK